jgi:hypothetical protein
MPPEVRSPILGAIWRGRISGKWAQEGFGFGLAGIRKLGRFSPRLGCCTWWVTRPQQNWTNDDMQSGLPLPYDFM